MPSSIDFDAETITYTRHASIVPGKAYNLFDMPNGDGTYDFLQKIPRDSYTGFAPWLPQIQYEWISLDLTNGVDPRINIWMERTDGSAWATTFGRSDLITVASINQSVWSWGTQNVTTPPYNPTNVLPTLALKIDSLVLSYDDTLLRSLLPSSFVAPYAPITSSVLTDSHRSQCEVTIYSGASPIQYLFYKGGDLISGVGVSSYLPSTNRWTQDIIPGGDIIQITITEDSFNQDCVTVATFSKSCEDDL